MGDGQTFGIKKIPQVMTSHVIKDGNDEYLVEIRVTKIQ